MNLEDPAAVKGFLNGAEDVVQRMIARLAAIEDEVDELTRCELLGLIYGIRILQLIWQLRLDPRQHEPLALPDLIDVPEDWMERDDWDSVDGEHVWVPTLAPITTAG
jgi:hypothetical protein